MKLITKRIAVLLAALLLCTSVIACGGSGKEPENPAAGTYQGLYYKFVGDDDSNKNTSSVFSMDLNADGTGFFHRDGNDYDLTWKLEGESITIAETFGPFQNDYAGTLKDGRLDLFNGDPEDPFTCEYVFEKQN